MSLFSIENKGVTRPFFYVREMKGIKKEILKRAKGRFLILTTGKPGLK